MGGLRHCFKHMRFFLRWRFLRMEDPQEMFQDWVMVQRFGWFEVAHGSPMTGRKDLYVFMGSLCFTHFPVIYVISMAEGGPTWLKGTALRENRRLSHIFTSLGAFLWPFFEVLFFNAAAAPWARPQYKVMPAEGSQGARGWQGSGDFPSVFMLVLAPAVEEININIFFTISVGNLGARSFFPLPYREFLQLWRRDCSANSSRHSCLKFHTSQYLLRMRGS